MKIHHPKKKNRFITTYIIAGGFLMAILLGTLILHLPFASANGSMVPWSDALFTATTSVCVTGLVTVPVYSTWSFAGQFIILILIQIGGLGLITFTMLFMLVLQKRIGLREQQLIRDAYNLDTNQGLSELVKKIMAGTLIVEGVGAILYAIRFVPQYGVAGIWKSIFNAVSAFCNAGMDVLGADSLIAYQTDLWVNLVTISLIVLGGLGFPIWFMTLDHIREIRSAKTPIKKIIRNLTLYEKTVFTMTFSLILGGAVLIFFMEYRNAATIGDLSLGNKILASLFQSVTTRTAGFCTIPQAGLRRCTILVCCVLMFIGGSPSGTAGGVKTTTFLVLMSSLFSSLSERNNTEIFQRRIHADTVRKAMSIVMVSFMVMSCSMLVFCMVQPGEFEDCLYEVVSSIGTVGLTRDLTANLTLAGKFVIIVTMYLGRIGPISLAFFFNRRKYVNVVQYPEENIQLG